MDNREVSTRIISAMINRGYFDEVNVDKNENIPQKRIIDVANAYLQILTTINQGTTPNTETLNAIGKVIRG